MSGTSAPRKPRQSAGAPAVLLAAAGAVAVWGLTPADASQEAGVLGGVIAVLLACAAALLWVRRVDQSDGNRASLVPVWVIYFGIAFGATSLSWRSPQDGLAARIDPAAVVPALGFVAVGILAFAVGYRLGPLGPIRLWARRSFQWAFPSPGRRVHLRFENVAVTLFALSIAVRCLALLSGNFGYLSNPETLLRDPSALAPFVSIFDTLGLLALVLACLNAFHFDPSNRARVVLAMLFMGELTSGFIAAQKSVIIVAVLIPLYLHWFFFRRLPFVAGMGAALVVLMAFPVVSEYRALVAPPGQPRVVGVEGAVLLPEALANVLTGNATTAVLSEGAGQGFARLRLIDSVALIVQRTPSQLDYESPEEILQEVAINLVPRAVWPDKPVLSQAYDFSQRYYLLPATIFTSSAITVPGDLYIHGGLPVLLIGMVLVGVLFRTLNLAFNPSGDVRRVIVYLPLFQTLINVELGMTSYLAALLHDLPVLLLAALVLFRTEPR